MAEVQEERADVVSHEECLGRPDLHLLRNGTCSVAPRRSDRVGELEERLVVAGNRSGLRRLAGEVAERSRLSVVDAQLGEPIFEGALQEGVVLADGVGPVAELSDGWNSAHEGWEAQSRGACSQDGGWEAGP